MGGTAHGEPLAGSCWGYNQFMATPGFDTFTFAAGQIRHRVALREIGDV